VRFEEIHEILCRAGHGIQRANPTSAASSSPFSRPGYGVRGDHGTTSPDGPLLAQDRQDPRAEHGPKAVHLPVNHVPVDDP
jgi:hypothetical protein